MSMSNLCHETCRIVFIKMTAKSKFLLARPKMAALWLDFITFIAYKKVKIKFKTAKCVSNRCKDLFKQKNYFGFRCTLIHEWFQVLATLFSRGYAKRRNEYCLGKNMQMYHSRRCKLLVDNMENLGTSFLKTSKF